MMTTTISPPFFMLIQDDDVLDCCQDPTVLMWSLLDRASYFVVAVGVINEEGKREIVGKCAEFHADPNGTVFYITSDVDGYLRLINKAGGPVDCIRNRIGTLYTKGMLSDPCNFSHIVLWDGTPN
jgi:hypothetical protein